MAQPSIINAYLLENNIRIQNNPAVSPDLVLDFKGLVEEIAEEKAALLKLKDNSKADAVSQGLKKLILWPKSKFEVGNTTFYLIESKATGDSSLITLGAESLPFENIEVIDGSLTVIPLYWSNLIRLKNVVQENDRSSTIFPKAEGILEHTSLGVGARFTTLHWPAVAWSMKQCNLSMTANQNSIPRELVYDVKAMHEDRLAQVPFPFIGRNVPEGHQGQSVQGMSHASIMTYLKYGFHNNRIAWGFNADHQPIGGRFDSIENELVEGSLFATYITYDLSPELTQYNTIDDDQELEKEFEQTVDKDIYAKVLEILKEKSISVNETLVKKLITYLTPAMNKMQKRDKLYTKIREDNFTTAAGRKFFKELSIDELPGQTTTETLAVCLAMAESMDVKFNYVAPNIGFTKNFPYPDNDELQKKIVALYEIAEKFNISFGFHSGSGKSAENYAVIGKATRGNFEVKTSGRYTYEMGKALSETIYPDDKKLWEDWYNFTKDLAVEGAFSDNETQRKFAREFIEHAANAENIDSNGIFSSIESLRNALDSLKPSPDHMFWFEYNFLFVLAGEGATTLLGDHSSKGYVQRKRFYSISDEARLRYAKNVASYLLFLTHTTGLISDTIFNNASKKLNSYQQYDHLLTDIS
ncbi:MAG: hypothetical protein GF401_16890 [Chitinivibrionales bacterium]|nr:hypothetical protein [Chitinivibrionales bacterium]